LIARLRELVGLHYAIAWPNREPPAPVTCCARRCPGLAARGACFGSKMGWSAANWFAPRGVEPRTEYAFGRQNWFAAGRRRAPARPRGRRPVRPTSSASSPSTGPEAKALLSGSANDLDVPVGRTVYTPLLNERGGYESD